MAHARSEMADDEIADVLECVQKRERPLRDRTVLQLRRANDARSAEPK